jgi:hypothetical protein
MRTTDPTTTQKYRDCLRLYLETLGENVTRIEREMRVLGHRDFSRRTLYARHDNGRRRPGWIERHRWKAMLDAVQTGGNTTGRECVPLTDAERGIWNSEPKPPVQGPHLDRAARVSATFGATARHTAPRPSVPRSALRIPHFKAWLKRVSPNMEWDLPHQEYLYSHLKRVTEGSCKRLMVFMPPRHGKSELVTARYTAWRIREDPSMNVILGSYNQRLADRFSRKVRRVLADDAAVTLKGKEVQSAGFRPSVGEAATAEPGGEPRQGPKHTARRRDLSSGTVCSTQERSGARTLDLFAQRPANTVSEWETAEGGMFKPKSGEERR